METRLDLGVTDNKVLQSKYQTATYVKAANRILSIIKQSSVNRSIDVIIPEYIIRRIEIISEGNKKDHILDLSYNNPSHFRFVL